VDNIFGLAYARKIFDIAVALKKHRKKSCSLNNGYYATSFLNFKIKKIPTYFDEMYFLNEKSLAAL